MNSESQTRLSPLAERVTSVDFFRGFTMFLLAGEASHLFGKLHMIDNGFFRFLGTQLEHHEGNGLHFWDVIQPFFMFIVGVAIPFAVANRMKKGVSLSAINRHAFKRSLLLLFFGWALYFIEADHLVFRFQNVLAQLSVAYLVAFLIRNKSVTFQILFTLILLLLIDLAYRFFPVAGFNQPWAPYQNLGAWFNNTIEGVDKASIWATLNFVSTTAHTVWGVLCGRLLMSEKSVKEKMTLMIIAGVSALVIGYALDLFHITPIIKKIATASFVFAGGGWTILVLCLCYWLIDVKKLFPKVAWFFIVVGMNSIFIYIFFHIGSGDLIEKMIGPFVKLFFSWSGELTVSLLTSLGVWAGFWYVCYWLYMKKIFIKI